MAKKKQFFSLRNAHQKIPNGQRKEWIADLCSALGYAEKTSVYNILTMPGISRMDIMRYRKINEVLAKYNLGESDWTITEQ